MNSQRTLSFLSLLFFIAVLPSCGGYDADRSEQINQNDDDPDTNPPDGKDPLAYGFSEGTANAAAPDARLTNSMWSLESSRDGFGIGFGQGNLYTAVLARRRSAQSIEAMGAVGTYSVAGNHMSFAPQKTSCPSFPNNDEGAGFQLRENSTLVISTSVQSLVLKRILPGNDNNFLVTWGCFSADGKTFTPNPWTAL